MKISEILDKAADVIEHNGWCRGAFIEARPGVPPEQSPCCVFGAVAIAEGRDPEFAFANAAIDALAEHLGLAAQVEICKVPEEDHPVAVWNDSQNADEVVRALRDAAAAEREAGR